jgi:hypothetical protein
MTQVESDDTSLNSDSSIDDQIASFWDNFQLFPSRIEEAIFKNPWLFSVIVLLPFVFRLLVSLSADLRDIPYPYYTDYTGSDWTWTYFSFDQWILFMVMLFLVPAVWIYNRFLSKILPFFQWLLEGKHISTQDGLVKQKYLQYLQEYQESLASRKGQMKIIIIAVAALLIWLLFIDEGLEQCLLLFKCTAIGGVVSDACRIPLQMCQLDRARFLISSGLGYLLWAIVAGMAIWVLYTTGHQLRKLTDNFELEIKAGHPDRSGGLSPIGSFCFDMALPMAIGFIAIVMIGVIQALHRSLDDFWPFPIYRSETSVAIILLLGFVLLTLLTIFVFFAPLSGIHQAMVQRKREVGDAYAAKLEEIENSIWLLIDDESKIAEAKVAKEQLETIQALDPDNIGYPEWPFRRETVFRLFSPQIAVIAIGLFLDLRDLFSG